MLIFVERYNFRLEQLGMATGEVDIKLHLYNFLKYSLDLGHYKQWNL